MKTLNSVYIATSIDGYIADTNGGLQWLESVPGLETVDTGYVDFTARIDAIVMGRVSYETVLGFGIDWPYDKPVFVLSNTLEEVPEKLRERVFPISGSIPEIVQKLHEKGFYRLYIDGGKTIQSFLKEDLIDEMIITTIPILLGGGSPLFSELPKELQFECIRTTHFIDKVSQVHFRRIR